MGSGVLLLGKTEEQNWSNRAIFGFSECGSCLPAAPLALGAAYASCRSCAQLRLPWCYVIKETGAGARRQAPSCSEKPKKTCSRKKKIFLSFFFGFSIIVRAARASAHVSSRGTPLN